MSEYRSLVMALAPSVYYRCERADALIDEMQVQDGVLVGAASVLGASGGGVAFSGDHTSSYGTVSDSAAVRHGASGLTVAAWLRADTPPPSGAYLLCKYHSGTTAGWAMQATSGARLQVYARGHTPVVMDDAFDGLWHHVALTVAPDGAGWASATYRDGVLVGTRAGALTAGEPSGSAPVWLARRGGGNGAACALDEIAIWPRALAAAEVAQLAHVPPDTARRVLTPGGLAPVTRRVLTPGGLVPL